MKSQKIKIEIKHWVTGSILFEYETIDNTILKTLKEAVLRGADLQGAYLQGAYLQGAYLQGADLQGADLQGADLQGADLQGAYLKGDYLQGAYLQGAYLQGAYLQGAKNLNSDATDFWWHIHHETLYEYLTEPIRARINYIKKDKPKDEIELRLKLMKPVLGKIPTTEKGWERLHKKECKDCPWNGYSIFN